MNFSWVLYMHSTSSVYHSIKYLSALCETSCRKGLTLSQQLTCFCVMYASEFLENLKILLIVVNDNKQITVWLSQYPNIHFNKKYWFQIFENLKIIKNMNFSYNMMLTNNIYTVVSLTIVSDE